MKRGSKCCKLLLLLPHLHGAQVSSLRPIGKIRSRIFIIGRLEQHFGFGLGHSVTRYGLANLRKRKFSTAAVSVISRFGLNPPPASKFSLIRSCGCHLQNVPRGFRRKDCKPAVRVSWRKRRLLRISAARRCWNIAPVSSLPRRAALMIP